jgi:hypothetical protein
VGAGLVGAGPGERRAYARRPAGVEGVNIDAANLARAEADQ